MSPPLPITEADLQAWIDGLLPEARRAEVDAYLASHPAEAERLAAYRAQNEALRRLFDPVLQESVPPRLHRTERPLRSVRVQRIAAAAAFAFIGVAAGWTVRGHIDERARLAQSSQSAQATVMASAEAALPRQAALAHVVYSPDVRRPVEIGAEQEDQLVAWLSKRIGADVKPPRLSQIGYELIGGRLLPGANGPVAQFMYHDQSGQRLTLYVSTEHPTSRETGFRFTQEGPVNVFYWIDGRFGYAISAGIDRAELSRVAAEVHRQLPT